MIRGVKYCGGCNPRYDRTEIVKRLREKYGSRIEIQWAKKNETYDYVLVICGCSSSCADHGDIHGTYGKKIIWTLSDLDIDTFIDHLLDGKGNGT